MMPLSPDEIDPTLLETLTIDWGFQQATGASNIDYSDWLSIKQGLLLLGQEYGYLEDIGGRLGINGLIARLEEEGVDQAYVGYVALLQTFNTVANDNIPPLYEEL